MCRFSSLLRLLSKSAAPVQLKAKAPTKSLWNFYVRKCNEERPAGSQPICDLTVLGQTFGGLTDEQTQELESAWNADNAAKQEQQQQRLEQQGREERLHASVFERFHEYPLPISELNSIEGELELLRAAFVERMNNEVAFTAQEHLEVDPPKRLCGHKYGIGSCKDDFTAPKLAQYDVLQQKILLLSEYGLPAKMDLNSVLSLLKLFRIYPIYGDGESAPSTVPQFVAVLLFSLKVNGYMRQVWLNATTPDLVVAVGVDVPVRFSLDNIVYDQDVVKRVLSWDKPIGIQHFDFAVQRKTLKHLTILGSEDISDWTKPTRKRKNETTEADDIAAIAKKPKPTTQGRGKTRKKRTPGCRKRYSKKMKRHDDDDAGDCGDADDDADDADDADADDDGSKSDGGSGDDDGDDSTDDIIQDDDDGIKLDPETEDMIEMAKLPWMVDMDSKDVKDRGKVFAPEDVVIDLITVMSAYVNVL